MKKVRSEESPEYYTSEQAIIQEALVILSNRMRSRPQGEPFTCPDDARKYVSLALAEKESEVFCCLFLNKTHQVIKFTEMFQGTIGSTSVYPREVVKACLKYNAAAVIFAHNHPSGNTEPSQADRVLTTKLVEALKLVDIVVLDHLIVANDEVGSMAELGLI